VEYQDIRSRMSELLNEIEIIKAKNLKDRPQMNGAGRESFERRWLRLEEIKQELRQLTGQRRSQVVAVPESPHFRVANRRQDGIVKRQAAHASL
jgi:cellulose biosynthesis protein BcsQ